MPAALGIQGQLCPFTVHEVTEVLCINFTWRVETKSPHSGAFKHIYIYINKTKQNFAISFS